MDMTIFLLREANVAVAGGTTSTASPGYVLPDSIRILYKVAMTWRLGTPESDGR